MLEIDCANERLQLLPEKAVFWPRTKTLILADLHFGKPAAFRKSGIAVPENTTADDLLRLDKILGATGSKRLIILGDFFHAAAGLQFEMMQSVQDWCQKHSQLQRILILGNHDKRAGRPPDCWNIEIAEVSKAEFPFLFCHEPKESSDGYVLSGHIHPAILLPEKFGGGIRAPCFCFGEHCAVLPAFGSFTGMRNIEPRQGDRIFAVGPDEIIEVSSPFGRARKSRSR